MLSQCSWLLSSLQDFCLLIFNQVLLLEVLKSVCCTAPFVVTVYYHHGLFVYLYDLMELNHFQNTEVAPQPCLLLLCKMVQTIAT